MSAGHSSSRQACCGDRRRSRWGACGLESEALLAADGSFREHGAIRLTPGEELRFRTLGNGQLIRAADLGLCCGTVTWEIDGGPGRCERATGRISSTFTLTDDGELADEQLGLIFLVHDTEA